MYDDDDLGRLRTCEHCKREFSLIDSAGSNAFFCGSCTKLPAVQAKIARRRERNPGDDAQWAKYDTKLKTPFFTKLRNRPDPRPEREPPPTVRDEMFYFDMLLLWIWTGRRAQTRAIRFGIVLGMQTRDIQTMAGVTSSEAVLKQRRKLESGLKKLGFSELHGRHHGWRLNYQARFKYAPQEVKDSLPWLCRYFSNDPTPKKKKQLPWPWQKA